MPGGGLGVQGLVGGQVEPGRGQTGLGLLPVPGRQLAEMLRDSPAAGDILRLAQQAADISALVK